MPALQVALYGVALAGSRGLIIMEHCSGRCEGGLVGGWGGRHVDGGAVVLRWWW